MSRCDIQRERVLVYRTGGVASLVSCGRRLGLAIATPTCSAKSDQLREVLDSFMAIVYMFNV